MNVSHHEYVDILTDVLKSECLLSITGTEYVIPGVVVRGVVSLKPPGPNQLNSLINTLEICFIKEVTVSFFLSKKSDDCQSHIQVQM